MTEPNCPWCGANTIVLEPSIRVWSCDSTQVLGRGREPKQSRICRIRQLEAENERLKKEVAKLARALYEVSGCAIPMWPCDEGERDERS